MKYFAIIFSILLTTLLTEVGLRVSGIVKTYTEINYDGKYVSTFQVAPFPTHTKHTHKTIDFDFPDITLNSLSIRSPEISSKQKNELRILFLGDSFTFGVGAPDEKTVAEQVSKYLKRDFPNQHISIINGGIPGGDIVSEVEFFHRKLHVYEPDIIFYFLNTSDVLDISSKGGFERYKRKNDELSMIETIWKHSHFFRAVMRVGFKWNWDLRSPEEVEINNQNAIKTIAKTASEFQKELLKSNRPFYIFFHPYPYELQYGVKNVELKNEITKYPNVLFIDLFGDFEINFKNLNIDQFSYPNDGHFNIYGYEKFAEIVYPKVKEIVKKYSLRK